MARLNDRTIEGIRVFDLAEPDSRLAYQIEIKCCICAAVLSYGQARESKWVALTDYPWHYACPECVGTSVNGYWPLLREPKHALHLALNPVT